MKKTILILAALFPFLFSSTDVSAEEPVTLTVMSYNIRMGSAKDGTNSWEYRYPASAMMIMDQKPDIFGLQEAFDYQQKYLKEYCPGYKCIGVGRENGKSRGEHMSIFYNKKRIKLLDWGTFWLSETPSKPSMGWDAACHRTATWALMKDKTTGKKFFYVNTHLDHVGAEARKNGLALILSKIKEINGEGLPMVLTGDFNVSPSDPCMDDLRKVMKDTRTTAFKTDDHFTYNGWGKSKATIDYIWYNGFSSCIEYETVTKPYMDRTYISDHFPIKAKLVF